MKKYNTDELVVLEFFNNTIEASIYQNKLQEAGIESILVDENVIGLNPFGGVALKIFAKDMDKAKNILLH